MTKQEIKEWLGKVYMRTIDEELELRKKQRETYFEDPAYRKWSDITPRTSSYAEYSELGFITSYLLGDCDAYANLSRVCELLTNGKQLPINWTAVYDYYDERYHDDGNRLWEEWFHGIYNHGDVVNGQSLRTLLNEFRNELVGDYDIV